MGDKYKVAVGSSDGETVDTHFGHAESFIVFEVDEETGSFEESEIRNVTAGCAGGECGAEGKVSEEAPLEAVAASLSDVDYVLVARIGPHAVRALAKHNVTAFDIVLPIGEAISKLTEFRKKMKARQSQKKS